MKNPRPFIRSFFSIFRATREKETSFVSTRSLLQEMSSVPCVSLVSNYLKAWTKFDPFSMILAASLWNISLLISSSKENGIFFLSNLTTFRVFFTRGEEVVISAEPVSCTTSGKNCLMGVNGLRILKLSDGWCWRRETRKGTRDSWGAENVPQNRDRKTGRTDTEPDTIITFGSKLYI